MISFIGQERCTIDSNGRMKLHQRFLNDFEAAGSNVVLHLMPEGCLGIFPTSVWKIMQSSTEVTPNLMKNAVLRRDKRGFGAFSHVDSISNQGRITIPPHLRKIASLTPGSEMVMVGAESYLEIWNAEKWEAECNLLVEHNLQKMDLEMRGDLESSFRDNITMNK